METFQGGDKKFLADDPICLQKLETLQLKLGEVYLEADFMDKIILKKWFWLIYIGIISILCLSCCLSFHFWKENGCLAIDSSIYYMVGERWLHGEIPYRDVFDHKGPLLYLINLVIAFCGGAPLFVIAEFLVFAITAFMIKKTLNLFVDLKCAAILLLFFPLMVSFCMTPMNLFGGNCPEEYGMPLVAYSVYYIADHLKRNEFCIAKDVFLGGALGALFLLKINLIFPGLAIGTLLMSDAIQQKNAKLFFLHCVYIALGIIIVWVPFGVYFYVNDALTSYFYYNFSYNLSYNQHGSMQHGKLLSCIRPFLHIANGYASTFSLVSLPACIVAGWFFLFRCEKKLQWTTLMLFAGFYVAAFSGYYIMNYYYFAAIPVFMFAIGVHCNLSPMRKDWLLLLSIILIFANACFFYKNVKTARLAKSEFTKNEQLDPLLSTALTKKKNPCFMSLDKHAYMYHATRKYSVKYSKFMYLPLFYSNSLEKDLENCLASEKPDYIFLPDQCRFPPIVPLIQENYNCIKIEGGFLCTRIQ